MEPGVIAGVVPAAEGLLQRGSRKPAVTQLPELCAMGAVGALHMPLELAGAERQHEEGRALLLTCLLEAGHELAAAITLDGAPGKRSRSWSSSRTARAGPAIATARTPTTLQRETTSTDVKWRRSTSDSGVRSMVSSLSRPPGCSSGCCFGLRMP